MTQEPLAIANNCHTTENSRRNELRTALSTLIWVGSWLLVLKAIKSEILTPGPLAYAAILATIALGVITVISFIHMLREADELQRKINLDALAFSVGVGVVGGLTSQLLTVVGLVPEDAFTYIITAMMVSYSLGVIIGHRRYS